MPNINPLGRAVPTFGSQAVGGLTGAPTTAIARSLIAVRNDNASASTKALGRATYDVGALHAWSHGGAPSEQRQLALEKCSIALTRGAINLDLSNMRLTSLPPIPPDVRCLNVSRNALVGLPALPMGLMELNCNQNALTDLPQLPAGLRVLDAAYNPLSYVPALPQTLQRLWLIGAKLTELPVLPDGLQQLFVSVDSITVVPPAWPSRLRELDFSSSVSELPPLPLTLELCDLRRNRLTDLPENVADLRCIRPDEGGERYVRLGMNPLSIEAQQQARVLTRREGMPAIHFSREWLVQEGLPVA